MTFLHMLAPDDVIQDGWVLLQPAPAEAEDTTQTAPGVSPDSLAAAPDTESQEA